MLGGTGDVDRFNLGHVADRLGIGRMGEHGALADAYATYDVLLKLMERVPGLANCPSALLQRVVRRTQLAEPPNAQSGFCDLRLLTTP